MFHTYRGYQSYLEACGKDPGLLGLSVEQVSSSLAMPLKHVLRAITLDQLDVVRVYGYDGSRRLYVPLRSFWLFMAKREKRHLELPTGLHNWRLALEEWSLRRLMDGDTDWREVKT